MERNITLDYFKVILSILIITIHIGILSYSYPLINWFVSQGIARIAVPCFFIISGYYFSKKIGNTKAVKKYLLHLLLVYTVWTVFYILVENFGEITQIPLLKIYVFGYFHLWYVAALLQGSIILFLIKKKFKNDTIILIVSILLFLTAVVFESELEIRNVLFMGFPFVFLGYYIQYKNLVAKVKDIYLLPVLILSFIGLSFEITVIARNANAIHDAYYSLIVFCPALIVFVFKHAKYREYNNTYLSYLGSLASAIYFIHVFVIYILSDVDISYTLVRFAIVCLLSFILSIFIIYINKYVKIFL